MKNSDFTEGRGPMMPFKIFKKTEDAIKYIMSQSGIYGSKQRYEVRFGESVKNTPYYNSGFNGFDIKFMDVE